MYPVQQNAFHSSPSYYIHSFKMISNFQHKRKGEISIGTFFSSLILSQELLGLIYFYHMLWGSAAAEASQQGNFECCLLPTVFLYQFFLQCPGLLWSCPTSFPSAGSAWHLSNLSCGRLKKLRLLTFEDIFQRHSFSSGNIIARSRNSPGSRGV